MIKEDDMTKTTATLSPDGKTITVSVPMKLRRRGGRKLIIAPDGAVTKEAAVPWPPNATKPDATLVKALARAFRWKRLLDTGKFATIAELAESERISDRYVARVLRLTLLAPDIVEAILDGRVPKGMGLAEFMEPWPAGWVGQRGRLTHK